ncbi:MAG: carboxylating nicotinate-nucleotide diphosphorylase [Pseudomonadota bacterium]
MPLKSLAGSVLSIFGNRPHQEPVLHDSDIKSVIALALQEDLGQAGDITSKALIDPHVMAKGAIIAKQDGVIAGLRCAELTFLMIESSCRFTVHVKDGTFVKKGTVIANIETSARGLLTAERTALNFLGQLSGIATLTRRYVEAVAQTKAQIRDTRKTTPGLRTLEKYAVACGGGVNHRIGLYDAVLIKDNHLALSENIADALQKAKASVAPGTPIEIEVDTLDQLDGALRAGAETILLDNMNTAQLIEAVQRTNGRAVLEASGGVNLDSVKAIAESGVDYISVGALTHSAPCLDISLDIEF